jgi:hypothetical protein
LSVYYVSVHFCPLGFQVSPIAISLPCRLSFALSSTPSAPFLPNLAFIVPVCSQFAVAAFIPSALLAYNFALLAFIFALCSQFALSAFICPVCLFCRRPFLPYRLSWIPFALSLPYRLSLALSIYSVKCPFLPYIGFHCSPFTFSLPCWLSFALSVCSFNVHFCLIGFHGSPLLSVCRGGFHSVCSVGLQFCLIGFHSCPLLSVCPVGFYLPCLSILSTSISALLAFFDLICSQIAMSTFICPVRLHSTYSVSVLFALLAFFLSQFGFYGCLPYFCLHFELIISSLF